MGTEILRPQDILPERMRLNPTVIPRRKPYYPAGSNSNQKPGRKFVARPEPKKRFPQPQTTEANLVMEQVTILKRVDYTRTNEKITGPETVPRQIRVVDRIPERSEEIYAGSACFMSPSPRALPLPTFSKKKEGVTVVDDSATKDLRRLLGLI